MTIQYIDPRKVTEVATGDACRPNPYASGYGPQIPTAHRLRYPQRWYRVYVMCWGDSGTPYIISRGRKLVLDAVTEERINPNSAAAVDS